MGHLYFCKDIINDMWEEGMVWFNKWILPLIRKDVLGEPNESI